jgi:hypothetical protein
VENEIMKEKQIKTERVDEIKKNKKSYKMNKEERRVQYMVHHHNINLNVLKLIPASSRRSV